MRRPSAVKCFSNYVLSCRKVKVYDCPFPPTIEDPIIPVTFRSYLSSKKKERYYPTSDYVDLTLVLL